MVHIRKVFDGSPPQGIRWLESDLFGRISQGSVRLRGALGKGILLGLVRFDGVNWFCAARPGRAFDGSPQQGVRGHSRAFDGSSQNSWAASHKVRFD